ncbi:MAG: radical SAM protein [Pirellulaceae bacterium]|nr:MAG: radical SAM protein [Pirellulaceae bacterium]
MQIPMRCRYRIRFAKMGDLRWIGHHDLARMWERIFRRAGVALAMSQGFHPKARISFPVSLPLGMVGCRELLEVELTEAIDPEELRRRLAAQAPEGLAVLSVEALPPQAPKAQVAATWYELVVPELCRAETAVRVEQLRTAVRWPYQRREDQRWIDIRADLLHLEWDGQKLVFALRHHHHAATRPRDLLDVLGLDAQQTSGLVIYRTDVELAPREPDETSLARKEHPLHEKRNAH